MPAYALYHHPYSICSIMVRYSFALRGPPKDPSSDMTLDARVVDMMNGEQLEEWFLCDVNPKGQVPVLVSTLPGSAPMADSKAITYHLAELYPNLQMPDTPSARELFERLHAINYFSLSFSGKPSVMKDANANMERRLTDPSISDRYRQALSYKIGVNEREKISALEAGEPERQREIARVFLDECATLLTQGAAGKWLFYERPTMLDAHLVPFLARLLDLGRFDEIIPQPLREYAKRAMSEPEWESVMQGRSTVMW
ncbi:hypothetical protein QBC46DRAFT_383393 [Diplogelasinospora grovesii]|uniref:GST N-terminal domain-containing protein n=1 Tax=Diplogelasinospora grovesii TaxID=303347 RepID=A0AAN6NBE2_9PEZI|nr:hypothetical protein QBC46DRAFT_383393 [Diplogelasinospora grovesii]